MTKHIEGWSPQTEFHIVVDTQRATEFASALAELAMRFDATVLPDAEEQKDVPFPFRHDLATEIYDEGSESTIWVVTRDNLHNFAVGRKFDGTLVSRAYNTIMRELSYRTDMSKDQSHAYQARGQVVGETDDDDIYPRAVSGLRVDKIAELQTTFAETDNIHGYSSRSKDFLKAFVVELFSPAD